MVKCNEEGRSYKYLGILETDSVRHEEMKQKTRKQYIRPVRNTLRTKLNGGNIITAMKLKAVSVIRYGADIAGSTKEGLEILDWKTRKLLTMYGVDPPKADIDKFYLRRAERGRALIVVEDCVRINVNSL